MNSLRRTVVFVRPYWVVAFFLVITVILPVAMELLVPRALSYVIDSGIREGDISAVVRGVLLMLGAALVGTAATLGQGVCRARLSQGLAYDMRNKMFAHIQSFSFANLDHMQTGQLMTRLASDVDLVRMFFSNGLALFLRALLMTFGSLVMMVIIDPQLTLIMVAILPLAGLLIWGVMKVAQPMFTVVQQKLSVLNTTVQENLAGAQVVKAFVRERYEIGRFQETNEDYMEEHIKVGRLMAATLPVLTILAGLGTVAVVWFGGMSVINDRISVGLLVAFNSYLMISMAPLLLLGNILTMFTRADASAARVWEVLDMQPALRVAESPHETEQLQGRVSFENVSFHYDGQMGARLSDSDPAGANGDPASARSVLREVSFEIEPGAQVALLGATGSGKSTLVHLIPRFYDVSGGSIHIDGVDVRDWGPQALRRHTGVVMQQTTLFSGTIRDNIAYGRPDASMAEVIAAAKAAQAHDFIVAMPDGYEAIVEERGANLSGGQKQRIAIARALLISPAILILDDSTSAVDMETEARIQDALEALKAGRTTFIVAQRLSSVLQSDKIILLENGRVVDQGTHAQLLARNDIYQEIFASQMGTA
jgi:ATP-binding cassette subfamily B protein